MPNNVLLTPSLITKLTLMNLADRLYITRNMSTAYTSQFGQKGSKIGASYDVRRPQRFTVTRDTLTYTASPLSDRKTTITVDKLAQVAFDFDSKERTLSLDFINERYAKPAAIAIANDINARAAEYIVKNTFNMVGTPGTTPNTLEPYLLAEDLMVAQGVPQNEQLTAIINRKMSSAFVANTVSQFNPQ